MKSRKLIFTLHKVLGLVTGVVVFIVSITGCCFAFKEEIESLYSDYKKVEVQDAALLTVTEAKTIAKSVFPNNTVHGTLFKKADDAVEVIFYDREPEFYQSVFINPYTKEVIQVDDRLSGFFAFVLKGHMCLWMSREVGEQIVGASIFTFMLIIISGFFLWIPKQRKNLRQRLKFDWKATTKWKRKNFDLHTVVGFYICIFALVFAFTGSLISYNWLKYVVYKSTGGDKVPAFIIPDNLSEAPFAENGIKPIDLLIPKLQKESPNAAGFELHYPASDTASIYVEVSNSEGLYYDADYRFFDQHTLEEIETDAIYGKYENAKIPDKILRMTYDTHIGSIGGIAGKVIAFLASLITASLPVTGILLWYGRTYKKKKKLSLSEVRV
ncbi:PepSY-associated TM helix domain-containing protein [Flammeovirgaceae bacterium SG7u.111]|nr:PepSY-associated TM helix domain-containing protein [Flammeovirgaceae bacterium SG7u.132]WPO37757.1 PepSY-associated TM helix domain-containing protein [Flammeovirgaceae bacterium SG7u.111]